MQSHSPEERKEQGREVCLMTRRLLLSEGCLKLADHDPSCIVTARQHKISSRVEAILTYSMTNRLLQRQVGNLKSGFSLPV